jgi:hypothetical protein
MDITKMSIVELKALAFDEIAKIKQAEHNLNVLNAEMQKRVEVPEAPVPESVPVAEEEVEVV